MGHCIDYFTVRKSETTPKKILAKLNRFAFDPHETDSYHGHLTFHENCVYPSLEKAKEAIKKFDRGFYDDHAVLYKEGRSVYWLVKYEFHC